MTASRSDSKNLKTASKRPAAGKANSVWRHLANWSLVLFAVSVETRFRASHQLTLPDGSKEPLHAHDWTVIADISSEKLNSMGLVADFRRLKADLDHVLADLDNSMLEKIAYFQQTNSSAENVAKYIYEKLLPALPKNVRLDAIRVAEQPGYSAKFAR
jgi:6-pyruvoyltetrahydropterin/6-carboxytetrahydropterin synthase